jgi:hypothetical protein
MNDLEGLNDHEDYKKIVKAVIESCITDYVKLSHPKNRNKKYLQETFLNSVDIFFNDSYRFDCFRSLIDESPLSTEQMISIMISSPGVSMEKTRQHVIDESIKYWWEKNFNDISVPNTVNVFGKVFSIRNASTEHIDYEKNNIFFPIKKTGSDRVFIKLCLKIILKESNIEIDEEQFEKLHKVFYLFIKINNGFKI